MLKRRSSVHSSVEENGIGYELAEPACTAQALPEADDFLLEHVQRGTEWRSEAGHRGPRFFCRTACDISNIVGHTCGVERAGKAYKLMTPKAEP